MKRNLLSIICLLVVHLIVAQDYLNSVDNAIGIGPFEEFNTATKASVLRTNGSLTYCNFSSGNNFDFSLAYECYDIEYVGSFNYAFCQKQPASANTILYIASYNGATIRSFSQLNNLYNPRYLSRSNNTGTLYVSDNSLTGQKYIKLINTNSASNNATYVRPSSVDFGHLANSNSGLLFEQEGALYILNLNSGYPGNASTIASSFPGSIIEMKNARNNANRVYIMISGDAASGGGLYMTDLSTTSATTSAGTVPVRIWSDMANVGGTVTSFSVDIAGNIYFTFEGTNKPIYRLNASTLATLSNESFELNNQISIYPNPVNDILNVDLNNEEIEKVEILTLEGKSILKSEKAIINTASLSNGVYLVKVYSVSGKVGVKKIIK